MAKRTFDVTIRIVVEGKVDKLTLDQVRAGVEHNTDYLAEELRDGDLDVENDGEEVRDSSDDDDHPDFDVYVEHCEVSVLSVSEA